MLRRGDGRAGGEVCHFAVGDGDKDELHAPVTFWGSSVNIDTNTRYWLTLTTNFLFFTILSVIVATRGTMAFVLAPIFMGYRRVLEFARCSTTARRAGSAAAARRKLSGSPSNSVSLYSKPPRIARVSEVKPRKRKCSHCPPQTRGLYVVIAVGRS